MRELVLKLFAVTAANVLVDFCIFGPRWEGWESFGGHVGVCLVLAGCAQLFIWYPYVRLGFFSPAVFQALTATLVLCQ